MKYAVLYLLEIGGTMDQLTFRGEPTKPQVNDVISVSKYCGRVEIAFLRPGLGQGPGNNYEKLCLHQCGTRKVETLYWCPVEFTSQFISLVCMVGGFDCKLLDHLTEKHSGDNCREEKIVHYFKLVSRKS